MRESSSGKRSVPAALRSACRALTDGLVDLLFPPSCAACGSLDLERPGMDWCDPCLEALPWVRSPMCPLCGRPFPKSGPSADHLCGECITGEFHFDGARSSSYHLGFVRDSLHAVKFGGQLHLALPLSQLITRTVAEWGVTGLHHVIPVPLHSRRLRQRGFNQAVLLARFLSRCISVPMDLSILKRRIWTVPQTRLSREERLKNVENAFLVEDKRKIEGKRVLLVDDVYTTGSTLSECARTLKEAGACRVLAVTVSRAVPEQKGAVP